MGSLDLRNVLIPSAVFRFLMWKDLLSLRASCKDFRKAVDNFIIKELGGVPSHVEVEINETNRRWDDVDTFLNLDFPVSSLYLNNISGSGFFEHDAVPEFLSKIGSKIRKLRVCKFTAFPSGMELNFYESLKNLTSLQVLNVVRTNITTLESSAIKTVPNSIIPTSWRKLQNIKICHNYNNIGRKERVKAHTMYLLSATVLLWCESADVLELGIDELTESDVVKHFEDVIRHVQVRACDLEKKSNLKLYNFKEYFYARAGKARRISPTFLQLCSVFHRQGVKVGNVPANFFKSFSSYRFQRESISNVVQSMWNLHPSVLNVALPKMTELSLLTLTQNSFIAEKFTARPDWPALQILTVIVTGTQLDHCTRRGKEYKIMPVGEMFDWLFCSEDELLALKTLKLRFLHSSRIPSWFHAVNCPNINNVVSCCPNITKLEISGWPGSDNLSFSKLWSGLPSLEEVSLTDCKQLGNKCFFGKDWKRPAFLQLKYLKKLSLLHLDQMPKITDKVFVHIFRHLKLSEFIISSKQPMKNVSMGGVFSLLSGDFGRFNEKFPFTTWSMHNVSREERQDLEGQFRRACANAVITKY